MTLDIRLTGTTVGIDYALAALKMQGYEWIANDKYYPQRGETSKFAYYLNDVTVPPIIPATPHAQSIAQSNDPQPGPYDAVLGNKSLSNNGD